VKPQLISQYVQTGKVKFQYRDFQFIGNESKLAAQGADCAAKQNQFWAYHDTLYANQQSENSGTITTGYLKQIAQKLGLDTNQFNQCIDTKATAQDVDNSYNEAVNQFKINSTPTVFVNGQKLTSATWTSLQSAIEAALAQK
jgi:protein-disulfide isomerase